MFNIQFSMLIEDPPIENGALNNAQYSINVIYFNDEFSLHSH